MNPQKLLEIQKKLEEIVVSQGKYVLSKWKDVEAIEKGEKGDKVTKIDKEVEQNIKDQLVGVIDGASFVGEETGGSVSNELFWAVDPIDGTKHFAYKMPNFFVQVSLIKSNEPILGVIYDPVTDQLFSASQGSGSFLNGVRLPLPKTVEINKAIVDVDFGGIEDLEWKSKVFEGIARKVYRVRISGGRFANYLVTGGINAFVVLNPTTKLWDQAPRIILFREIGFNVIQFEKNGHLCWVVSDSNLSNLIMEIISSVVL